MSTAIDFTQQDARASARQLLGLNDATFTALVDGSIAAFSLEEVSFSDSGEALDARVLYVNAAHGEHSGIARADALGAWISELLPDLDETWVFTAAQALRSRETQQYRMVAPGKTGWCDGYIFPVTDTVIGSSFIYSPPGHAVKSGGVAEFGDLTLDAGARVARVGSQDLALTRTEFDILGLLVTAPGRALSSKSIVESVTNERWLPTDRRKLAVHVHNLRRKLTAHGYPGHHITTMIGYGYRFDPED